MVFPHQYSYCVCWNDECIFPSSTIVTWASDNKKNKRRYRDGKSTDMCKKALSPRFWRTTLISLWNGSFHSCHNLGWSLLPLVRCQIYHNTHSRLSIAHSIPSLGLSNDARLSTTSQIPLSPRYDSIRANPKSKSWSVDVHQLHHWHCDVRHLLRRPLHCARPPIFLRRRRQKPRITYSRLRKQCPPRYLRLQCILAPNIVSTPLGIAILAEALS